MEGFRYDSFSLVLERTSEVLWNYSEIFGDSPFDVSLEEAWGFKSGEHGFKQLDRGAAPPNAITIDGGPVELTTLHHQGPTKILHLRTRR